MPMQTPDVTPNLLNDVLQPEDPGQGISPQNEPATSELDACASEMLKVDEGLDAPGLSAERRRSLVGQTRVYQAVASAIGARILARSERVAKEAQIKPEAVENLLLFETALGSVRLATWPVTAYALLTVRNTGAQIDAVLGRIDDIAARPEGRLVRIALGQAQHVQQRGVQSQKAGQKQRNKRKMAGAEQAAQKRQRITWQQGAQRLAHDLGQGAANPPLPATAGQTKTRGHTKALGPAAPKGKAKPRGTTKPKGKGKAPGGGTTNT